MLGRSVGPCAAEPDERPVERVESGVRVVRELAPVELRALEVAGSCGSGTTAGSQPLRANSAMRPFAVASPRSGSGWDVKKLPRGGGTPLLAHDEPWGVPGAVRVSTATTDSRENGQRLAEPIPDRAIADLVVVLRERDEPSGGHRRRDRGAWLRPRKEE